MIIVANRRRKQEKLMQEYPGAIIVDITSKAEEPLVKLSPFYPHGGIPIPFSSPATGASVEGIWQGLKVFESVGIDREVIQKRSMKGLKRSVRRFGPPRGHQRGLNSSELLDYMTARREIYLPTYRWVLEHKVLWIIDRLRAADRAGKTIILLDYNSSTDVDDPKKPLSHAYLVKAYAEGLYPYEDAIGLKEPISQRSVEQSLASSSFQLSSTTRPEKPVVVPLSTKVTDEDLAEAYTDEYGVKFSPDRKRLLDAPRELVSYTIPDTVTAICNFAFFHSFFGSFISELTIPNSVISIGDSAFENCSNLTSLTIPNSITTVGSNPFRGLTLQLDNRSPHFYVEDNVLFTADKKLLIAYCSRQTSYSIPNSVTSIGDGAFWCSRLTSLTIPDLVTTIGDSAFYWCSSLISLTIPNSVTSIGDWAFKNCSSLTSLTIPNSVTAIGDSAFWHCSSLTSLTIPESVTTIGVNAFSGLILQLDNRSPHFYVEDNVLFTADKSQLIAYCSPQTSYCIPDSVTTIGDRAFLSCSRLTSLTIPNSVTSISNNAFSGCSSLTSLTIPASVSSIGDSAFENCRSLTSLTIPASVSSIGDNAFENCRSLTSLTISNSVTAIGDSAFWNCYSLTSLTIPDSVTTIGDSAFDNCTSLTSLTIPNSVSSIGDCAFWNCSRLTTLTIPDSVTSIGRGALYGCKNLNQSTREELEDRFGKRTFEW